MKSLKLFGFLAAGAAMVLGLPGIANAAKAKYAEIAVENGGSVTGKVSFEGALPASAVENILITKNPEVCGDGEREVVWIDVKDGALRGTFVFLKKIKEGKAWTEPEGGQYLIDQKDCRFQPWAQVVKPGPVIIRNSDKGVLHNINTREMIGVETPHPYAVVVGEDGSYEIGDIPAGDYTLQAWHPTIGLQETKITVPAGGSAEADFSFSAQ
jgi:hypothetical protein